MQRCPNCGASLPQDARFCIHCMTSLNAKTYVKPYQMIGRWPIYSAIALLLCTALCLHLIFALKPHQKGGSEDVESSAGQIQSVHTDRGTSNQTQDSADANPLTTDSEVGDSKTTLPEKTETDITDTTSSSASSSADADMGTESEDSSTDTNTGTEPEDSSADANTGTEPEDSSTDTNTGTEPEDSSDVADFPLQIVTKTEVPEGYIGIYGKQDLNNVRNDLSANYILMSDIVFTEQDFAEGGAFYNDGQGWIPIGSLETDFFSGTFDGNNYAIKNLYVNASGTSDVYAGFFGSCKGTVKNLGMEGSEIISSQKSSLSGGIVGFLWYYGKVTNCYNTGRVTSPSQAGGIVGQAASSATIEHCYNAGTVSSRLCGGIVAFSGGAGLRYCYNVGNVHGTKYSGGIVGYSQSSTCNFQNCYNGGTVTGDSSVGGILGYYYGSKLKNCYNVGTVSGGSAVGGIAGTLAYDEVAEQINCYYLDTNSRGIGNAREPDGCQKLTKKQMKEQSSFAGFDFNNIWTMGKNEYPYPIFRT